MLFEVKYRGADGAISTTIIESANRTECMAECRRRGIAPVGMKEGRAGGTGKHGLPVKKLVLFACAAVIALAVSCVWYFGRTENVQEPAKKAKNVVRPANPGPKRSVPTEPTQTNVGRSAATTPASVNAGKKGTAALQGASNATDGQVEDMAASAPTNSSPLSRPSPFKSGTEQVMGWIFMCPVGKMPPMLPAIPPEELARIGEILDSPNLVQNDDSERVADMKETVSLAKEELKAFLAQGGKVEDFLAHYHGILVKAHRAREAARMAAESVDRDDPGLSEEFRKKVNEMLNKEGIEALDDK